MPLIRMLALAFAAVLAFDLLGFVVASSTGREDLLDAFVTGTPLNAPFTFVAVQALAVLAAIRLRGGAGRSAAMLLVLLCALSVVSGFADGAYETRLGAGERAVQLGIVTFTAALAAVAAALAAGRASSGPTGRSA